jgi:hypothetical protein
MTDRRRNDDGHSPLILGLILLAIGAGLLAGNLGFKVPVDVWHYWPFVLVVPGVIGALFPSRHLTRTGGVWLLATGIYGIFGMYRLFGLGWSGAWPVFIIAAGFNVIFEDRHRRCTTYGQNEHDAVSDSGRDAGAAKHH